MINQPKDLAHHRWIKKTWTGRCVSIMYYKNRFCFNKCIILFAKQVQTSKLQFRRGRRLIQSYASWERLWEMLRRGQRLKKKNETRQSRNSRLPQRSVKKCTREISKYTSLALKLSVVLPFLFIPLTSVCFVFCGFRHRGRCWIK